MRHTLLYILLCTLLTSSCASIEQYDDTPFGCIEALWRIMDEHYCFFTYKEKELGVNWDEVHERYLKQVNERMSKYQLFEVMTSMLGELRDGHVNLSTAFDYGRNWTWKENYPSNFSDTLQQKILNNDYKIASGLLYKILNDNTGYIYCETFDQKFGDGNLDEIMYYLATCNKLIIDVRNNGGGMLTSAEKLASRFINKSLVVGYMQHKTGRGHDDFSNMERQTIEPSKGIRWQKPVIVLTNRSVYSAANEFVKYMKAIENAHKEEASAGYYPQVTIIGDTTGGGAGLPFSSELPNGWGVRFSACPMYDYEKNSTEHGIEPDIKVDITPEDFSKGIDTIIETAKKMR